MIHQFKSKDIEVLEDATLSIQLKNFESLAFITSKSICKYVHTLKLGNSKLGFVSNCFTNARILLMRVYCYLISGPPKVVYYCRVIYYSSSTVQITDVYQMLDVLI